jgi:hypothetical protein
MKTNVEGVELKGVYILLCRVGTFVIHSYSPYSFPTPSGSNSGFAFENFCTMQRSRMKMTIDNGDDIVQSAKESIPRYRMLVDESVDTVVLNCNCFTS